MGGLCHFHAILEYIEPIAWQYSRELDQDDYRVKSTSTDGDFVRISQAFS